MSIGTIPKEKTISKSYSNATALRFGNVITIIITEQSSVTHTQGQWNTICTIDPIFRPRADWDFVINNYKASNASALPLQCRITQSGNVMIWPYVANVQAVGTMTYVI